MSILMKIIKKLINDFSIATFLTDYKASIRMATLR